MVSLSQITSIYTYTPIERVEEINDISRLKLHNKLHSIKPSALPIPR